MLVFSFLPFLFKFENKKGKLGKAKRDKKVFSIREETQKPAVHVHLLAIIPM